VIVFGRAGSENVASAAGRQYSPDESFCTGFYLIADEATGALEYAGVGHPPALAVGPDGARQLDSIPGLLGIGMVEGPAVASDRLEPGESLLIHTDGLTDARDLADVLFGTERITAVLKAHATAGPSEILDQIDQAVARHVAPGQASDDVNMVLIQNPPR